MENLQIKFKEIQDKYDVKILSLKEELNNHGYFHTLLNLRKQYSLYINELNRLFEEYDYILSYILYQEFYKVCVKKYNLFFSYSKYVKGSGNLPGAFLEEAIHDLEVYCIHTLLLLERNNTYEMEDSTIQLLSIQAYDAILETKRQYSCILGYAIDEIEVSKDYQYAAHNLLSFLGDKVADKAYEYYNSAIDLLKESSASATHNSFVYYTYYITMYNLLDSYKYDIDKYNLKCDFDIDKEIYECMYKNYRQAQACSRDKMITQVNNLIASKSFEEARKISKEIIDICEERVANIQVKGVKLSLKNAYELFLSIPETTLEEQNTIKEKLNNLVATMTHDDFYCKDGAKEYPMQPY